MHDAADALLFAASRSMRKSHLPRKLRAPLEARSSEYRAA